MSVVDLPALKLPWDSRYSVDVIRKCLQPVQEDAGIHLADDIQEGDSSVVVTIAANALVLVKCRNCGISHILRDCAFLPAECYNPKISKLSAKIGSKSLKFSYTI